MKSDNLDPPENAPIKNGLTKAERQRLVDLHFERGQQRQVEEGLRLAQTIAAGQAVNRLGKS